MPATFFTLRDGSPRAVMGIRRRNDGTVQTLGDAVPDGDTVGIQLDGTGAVRFLGVDTPEKSFQQPLGGAALLSGQPWEQFLSNPFAPGLPASALEPALADHLRARMGSGAAANHHRAAIAASDALRNLIQADITALGQASDAFGYFVAFSYEIFDRNGRFLAFVNRNQPDANVPAPRPDTYNERMLESGHTLPYFIWPNIDPFRKADSIAHAVLAPKTANTVAQTGDLGKARAFVKAARAAKKGVFNAADALRFEAFEIRYLGRGEAPNRAVIDLSRNDDLLLRPQSYFKIPHAEDRLFVPAEFVPLFAAKGWRLEGFA
jgi:endonuclease YncB( thermonuclease family)